MEYTGLKVGDLEPGESDIELKYDTKHDFTSPNDSELSPNKSLNSHTRSNATEGPLYEFIGTALQAAVLVYSGYASYSTLQERLDGPSLHTGFILQATGTIMVTPGMILCAWIIDDSTEETEWVGKLLADKR